MRDLILAIRRTKYGKRATILVAIEDNMAHEAGNLFHNIRKLNNVHAICDKSIDRIGIRTNQWNKPRYAAAAREHVVRGSIEIARDLICSNEHMLNDQGRPIAPEARAGFIKNKLREQLLRYKKLETSAVAALANTKRGFTGVADRQGKRDPTAKDDLAFAFTFALGVVDMLRQNRLPLVNKAWLPKFT
jgi:hypothetical protein